MGGDEMGTTVECPVCGADEIIFPMKNNGDNGKEPVTDEEIEAFMASNTWYTKKIYKLGRGVTVKGIVKEIKNGDIAMLVFPWNLMEKRFRFIIQYRDKRQLQLKSLFQTFSVECFV